MSISEFLVKAMGLQGVKIESTDYNEQDLTAEVVVRQDRETCCCNHCGGKLYGVHQWRRRELKGPPLAAFRSITLVLWQLQGACDRCQALRMAKVPFIHPGFKNLTTAFCEIAGRFMEETTCEAVGRLLDHPSKSLWSLDQWRIEVMKKNFNLPDKLHLELLSADEVHMRSKKNKKSKSKKKWNRQFITNLVSYSHSKVIANAAGRTGKSLERCLNKLTPEQLAKVTYISVDMNEAYINMAEKMCPNARVALDRFHLVQLVNKKFDEVRKSEIARVREQKDKFQQKMLSGSNRFILVSREFNLTKTEKTELKKLRKLNENIHNGMLIVEYFRYIMDLTKLKDFRKTLKYWLKLVEESNLKPFMQFKETLLQHQHRIEGYIKSGLTTAVSEGLNNKIKVLKRMGYGYSNITAFKNKILQRCGFINSYNISTNHWMWHVA